MNVGRGKGDIYTIDYSILLLHCYCSRFHAIPICAPRFFLLRLRSYFCCLRDLGRGNEKKRDFCLRLLFLRDGESPMLYYETPTIKN